jgi:hypothetical protein
MVNEHRAPLEAASPEVWAALTDDQKGDAESAEGWAKTDKPELIKKSDTFVHRLFNPMYNEKLLIVERQKKPAPAGEGQ